MVAVRCSGWLLGDYDAVATVFQVNKGNYMWLLRCSWW